MNDDAEYQWIIERVLAARRAGAPLPGTQIASNTTTAPATRKRNSLKNISKVISGKRLAKHSGASAWRTACTDLGYLRKGVAFKRLPAKDTAEYNKIKALKQAYESRTYK